MVCSVPEVTMPWTRRLTASPQSCSCCNIPAVTQLWFCHLATNVQYIYKRSQWLSVIQLTCTTFCSSSPKAKAMGKLAGSRKSQSCDSTLKQLCGDSLHDYRQNWQTAVTRISPLFPIETHAVTFVMFKEACNVYISVPNLSLREYFLIVFSHQSVTLDMDQFWEAEQRWGDAGQKHQKEAINLKCNLLNVPF